MPPEFTDELFAETERINDLSDNWLSGVGLDECNNVRVREEMTKLTGGPLLWSTIDLMKAKAACLEWSKEAKNADPKFSKLCTWVQPLKYYVNSAVSGGCGQWLSI